MNFYFIYLTCLFAGCTAIMVYLYRRSLKREVSLLSRVNELEQRFQNERETVAHWISLCSRKDLDISMLQTQLELKKLIIEEYIDIHAQPKQFPINNLKTEEL